MQNPPSAAHQLLERNVSFLLTFARFDACDGFQSESLRGGIDPVKQRPRKSCIRVRRRHEQQKHQFFGSDRPL